MVVSPLYSFRHASIFRRASVRFTNQFVIQAFIPEASVEALHVAVLHRFAGLNMNAQ